MRTTTDTERLNWMAAHGADFCYTTEMSATIGVGVRLDRQTIGVRVPRLDDYGYEVYDAPTLRGAIDKAMRETKQPAHFPINHRALQEAPNAN